MFTIALYLVLQHILTGVYSMKVIMCIGKGLMDIRQIVT